ncbi:MAG TPA: 30S ribosomal protein S12 methylthiotransferase RimO, partial [Terriglobales bacterium]|nr:30S ribosomal protein S12 methylthiotransferase RimO [Terriglobales bacterium]
RRKLMQIQKPISRRRKKALIGSTFEMLVEGPSAESELLWEGRMEMHAPEIDGKVFLNDFGTRAEVSPGQFYCCEVTEAHDYDLVVKLV